MPVALATMMTLPWLSRRHPLLIRSPAMIYQVARTQKAPLVGQK